MPPLPERGPRPDRHRSLGEKVAGPPSPPIEFVRICLRALSQKKIGSAFLHIRSIEGPTLGLVTCPYTTFYLRGYLPSGPGSGPWASASYALNPASSRACRVGRRNSTTTGGGPPTHNQDNTAGGADF